MQLFVAWDWNNQFDSEQNVEQTDEEADLCRKKKQKRKTKKQKGDYYSTVNYIVPNCTIRNPKQKQKKT